MKKIVLVSITVMMASACTTPILNTMEFRPEAKAKPKIGVPYYLPKALIPLTITLEKDSAQSKGDETAGNIGGDGTTRLICSLCLVCDVLKRHERRLIA